MKDIDIALAEYTELFRKNQELRIFAELFYVREVENLISNKYIDQVFRCPVHLSIGQEGVAVGVSRLLSNADKIVSTHRSHAHYLAKGGNLFKFFAELMGSPEGCCGGRGGSMHLFDSSVGVVASIPIGGSSTPIALGIAFAEKKLETNNIAVSFVGDAVLETGAFYESLNIAALKSLPILFVVEDNGFSTYADKSVRAPASRNVKSIVEGMGIKFLEGNGDDVLNVQEIANHAILNVRNNNPTLIEFKTFRRLEHCGPNNDDSLGYRALEELESYSLRDPLFIMEQKFKQKNSSSSVIDLKIAIESYVEKVYEKALLDLKRNLSKHEGVYPL